MMKKLWIDLAVIDYPDCHEHRTSGDRYVDILVGDDVTPYEALDEIRKVLGHIRITKDIRTGMDNT